MDKNDEAMKALMDGIKLYVDNAIRNAPFNVEEIARVSKVNDDGTYNIILKGSEYINVSLSGLPCEVNEMVKVIIPKNNYNYLYIQKYV